MTVKPAKKLFYACELLWVVFEKLSLIFWFIKKTPSFLAAANKYDRPALPKGRPQMLLKNITSKQTNKIAQPCCKSCHKKHKNRKRMLRGGAVFWLIFC
jgi:hypothetical protein